VHESEATLAFPAPVAQGIERAPPEREVAGSIPAGRISAEQPQAPSGANPRQIAPQLADSEHHLLELSALDARTPLAAAPPISVDRLKNSRSEIVGVSLAAILAAPSISA
jgi:hypothetical protein